MSNRTLTQLSVHLIDMRIFVVIVSLFVAMRLHSQEILLPKEPLQQNDAVGQIDLLSAAVNWRGELVAAGNFYRDADYGQNIAFVKFDSLLGTPIKRDLGRKNEDGAGQIAVLPDGRYVIVGYSTKPTKGDKKIDAQYFGKRDGWVLILNERGDTEQQLLLGTTDDDVFVTVSVCPDGSMWLAGNSGKQAWIVRLSAQLEVMWERHLQHKQLPTQIAASTLMPDGQFFVTGGTTARNRKNLWVAGFDADGKTILDKILPDKEAEEGTAIVAYDALTLAIAGSVYDPKDRENGAFFLMDFDGDVRSYNMVGGRDYDQIRTLIRLNSQQFLSAGGSASFERGSRRKSAWITLLSTGSSAYEDRYYGGKQDDEVLDLVEHGDGRIFAIGTTARISPEDRQGWIFQLTKKIKVNAPAGTILPKIYAVNTAGAYFNDKKLTYVPFTIDNTGEAEQYNLRASVTLLNAPVGVTLLKPAKIEQVVLPAVLANSRLAWGLPLQFLQSTPPGKYTIQVQFFQGKTPIGAPQTMDVLIGTEAEPKLEVLTLTPKAGLTNGVEQDLTVEVRNTGNAPAQGLTLTATAPDGVELPARIVVGDLAAGQKMTTKLPIKPVNTQVGVGSLPLTVRVDDEALKYFALHESRLDVFNGQEVSVKPVANTTTANQPYTVAIWVYPNPLQYDQKEISWPQEEITIQIQIESNQPITNQQFCLEINGQPCPTGAKFDEVKIKGDKNSKIFSQTIRLSEGANQLKAILKTSNSNIQSEPLTINYSPSRPNLHIISIGVPSSDLKYTVKDARDFALALAAAGNQAYSKVYIDTLLSEDLTSKTEILKALRRLQYRVTNLQILPNDQLVVFISGHGLAAYDGSFRLAASDYDNPFMQETSLDFEQEIVNYLQNIPCSKMFFVDACHSGTASGSGLAGIAARKSGLNMMVSCQQDEYSYEDDAWKNGAFTYAILQEIKRFSTQSANADANSDKKLDANEFFESTQKPLPK
jgi:hypothetical protein